MAHSNDDARRATLSSQLEKLEKTLASPEALKSSVETILNARDADKSGTINNLEEIKGFLKSIYGLLVQKHEVTDDEAQALLDELDSNKDGVLTVEELTPAVERALTKRCGDLKAKLGQ
jgi:Ca2+-binding EF-hand superfamily protein